VATITFSCKYIGLSTEIISSQLDSRTVWCSNN